MRRLTAFVTTLLTFGCSFDVSARSFAPPAVATMKLVFSDDFNGTTLDLSRWQVGTDGRGKQWGSEAHFVTKDEPQFSETYRVSDGVLTIRATYDADTGKWWHWRGGAISTVFSDGRTPSAVIRHGYVETRQRFPSGPGTWPGAWAQNLAYYKGTPGAGHVEIDGFEHYGVSPHKISTTVHDWSDPMFPGRKAGMSQSVQTKLPNLSEDWHVYGFLVETDTVTTFVDGVQVNQATIVQKSIDGFGWMFNLAMGGGWPIKVPESGHYDLGIDYVRIFTAD